jgi:hypothetical protein
MSSDHPFDSVAPEPAGDHDMLRFRLTWYDATRIHTREATWAEVQKLDPKTFDLYESEPQGLFGFRTSDGEWQKLDGDWPKLGPVVHGLLHALQGRPGIFQTPDMLAKRTGLRSLEKHETTAAKVMKLREFLLEKGQPSWFIHSRRTPRYSIRWDSLRTWMRVEYLRPEGPGHKP